MGVVGVGWIGLHRMDALVKSRTVEVTAVADHSSEALQRAAETVPLARIHPDFESLLSEELDGLVIATPSALHASQAKAALGAGLAVFCQKPLARTAEETLSVVTAARDANRLLGVDLSYRQARAVQRVRELLRSGDVGDVYAAELVFHTAYGPEKAWYYRPEESGGGCVMDTGIHLVDLALWLFDGAAVGGVAARCLAGGRPLRDRAAGVEDYATARIDLVPAPAVSLSCSWRLPVGCDALIEMSLYGSKGGLAVRNVNGSFYDFRAERYRGTSREVIDEPPDAWGGRAVVEWARQLAAGQGYDPEVERVVQVARVVDEIYRA